MSTNDALYLNQAIALATDNVSRGGGPFGAVVVTAEGAVFQGVNRVTALNDPTAHGEVMAIRTACSTLGTFDLTGTVLYTSCEPCPMCLAAALWARVERVVFAADRFDAASAGFDDAAFYEFFSAQPEQRSMPVAHLAGEDIPALQPFEAWNSVEDRVDY